MLPATVTLDSGEYDREGWQSQALQLLEVPKQQSTSADVNQTPSAHLIKVTDSDVETIWQQSVAAVVPSELGHGVADQPSERGGIAAEKRARWYPHLLATAARPLKPKDLDIKLPLEAAMELGYCLITPEGAKKFCRGLDGTPELIADLREVPGLRVGQEDGHTFIYMKLKGFCIATPSRDKSGHIQALQLHSTRRGKIESSFWLSSNTEEAEDQPFKRASIKADTSPHYSRPVNSSPLTDKGVLQLACGIIEADTLAWRTSQPAIGVVHEASWERDIPVLLRKFRPSAIEVYYGTMSETPSDVGPFLSTLRAEGYKVSLKACP